MICKSSVRAFIFIGSLIISSGFLVGIAQADIYTGFFNKKAVSGYDTVAFFTDNKAVKGSKEFSFRYQGADWYFSSAEHLALFKAEPQKYAPQYGGHCAWAVSEKSTKVAADPDFWKIVDGKLYLNYNDDVQEKWLKDIAGHIQQADKNWPAIIDQQ
jgi:YHS domain-containing protein